MNFVAILICVGLIGVSIYFGYTLIRDIARMRRKKNQNNDIENKHKE